jgi:hypothetical protein
MKLPYGIADFYSLVTSGYRYVDRTARIRTLEEMGRSLLFLRPRRFGTASSARAPGKSGSLNAPTSNGCPPSKRLWTMPKGSYGNTAGLSWTATEASFAFVPSPSWRSVSSGSLRVRSTPQPADSILLQQLTCRDRCLAIHSPVESSRVIEQAVLELIERRRRADRVSSSPGPPVPGGPQAPGTSGSRLQPRERRSVS